MTGMFARHWRHILIVVALFVLLRRRGAVQAGEASVIQRPPGAPVTDRSIGLFGCPPGERLRPARGKAPAVCVPR
jgi:hypothetical protein